MIRVIVADDEPLALRGMVRLLARFEDIEVVGTATTGPATLEVIQVADPDLVFLDIQMPGANGLEVAEALAKDRSPDIIFVTAFDSHAIEAFALDAVDYLLKPVEHGRLHQSLLRARRRLAGMREPVKAASAAQPATLIVPDRHGGVAVPQADIIWIEAAKDYGLVHTEHRSFILRTTMTELAKQLAPPIIRVHRSAYVSMEKVERLELNEKGAATLVLPDRLRIGVGPSYVKAVRAAVAASR
jgi:DNA-binding LytR/AlgR family response regulator